ncbi:hypothetical protein [Halioxenophilus aromaticivorans]|uniref:Uncharacterized protein n=1 Tax=Halioxenophilus aromaticivorans TaxID=1306992 RepID=A0AAV3TWR6_9ALTE
MLPTVDESARAVLFLKHNEIIGEMLYTEFEAVLDAFIPLPNFASQSLQAVYIELNHRFHLTVAVFFLIDFDHQGFADRGWNLPIQQLVESAAKGPDLGSGPIRLACYTQCPVQWHQRSLWDPDMSPGRNDFTLIQRTIEANKMGVAFKKVVADSPPVADAIPTLTSVEERRLERGWLEELESELKAKLYRSFRNRLANTLKKQRLRLATLRNKQQKRIELLNRDHQARVDQYRTQIADLQTDLETQKSLSEQVKQTLDNQTHKMSQLRQFFEERLKSTRYTNDEQIQLLNQQFEAESQARVESVTKNLKETVQLREIELMYLTEQQSNLLDEITSLKHENAKLQEFSGDRVIDKLSTSGISFIAYQVGLGHINVNRDELTEYTQNPEAFAAAKCGVSLPTYRSWLDHFSKPRCQAIAKNGNVCNRTIPKINSPLDFHSGESDRCDEHRENKVVNFRFGQ